MGDLTKNLSRHEFACKCGCGFNVADFETVNILQETADHFAVYYQEQIIIDIRGANRCRAHNETVQKKYKKNYVPYSSKSTHMTLGGVDFKLFRRTVNGSMIQITPWAVHLYLDSVYPNKLGLGVYSNRNHMDPRARKARWGV